MRNSVGFDWHPVTGEFFFTENGADEMGDNFPDDVLHIGLQKGDDFGFPYCHVEVHLSVILSPDDRDSDKGNWKSL